MFLILEGGISTETISIIAGLIALVVASRLKIVKEYFTTSKGLVENYKADVERMKSDLEREKAKVVLAEAELKEMKEENKVLHREIAQRIEIHLEDQDTIRGLRRKNG